MTTNNEPNPVQPTIPNNPPAQPPAATNTGLTAEQIESLIAKARKEEKDKLYPEMTDLRTRLKQLEADNKALNQQLQDKAASDKEKALMDTITQLKTEIEDLKKGATLVNNNNPQQPPQNQPDPAIAQMQTQIDNLTKLLEAQTKATAEANASQVRAQLIAAAGPNIIPEMITGTTPEEIAASIERSKQVYQTIHQKVAAEVVAIPPANPVGDMSTGELTPDEIANMSMEQWAQYRQKLNLR